MEIIEKIALLTLGLNLVGNFIYFVKDGKYFKEEFTDCENNFEKIKFIAIYTAMFILTVISGHFILSLFGGEED